jgi:hypothetical protein
MLKGLGIELIPASAPDHFPEDTPTAVLVRQRSMRLPNSRRDLDRGQAEGSEASQRSLQARNRAVEVLPFNTCRVPVLFTIAAGWCGRMRATSMLFFVPLAPVESKCLGSHPAAVRVSTSSCGLGARVQIVPRSRASRSLCPSNRLRSSFKPCCRHTRCLALGTVSSPPMRNDRHLVKGPSAATKEAP